MTDSVQPVIARYFSAADSGDVRALAECFTLQGEVIDEGVTYRGHQQIIAWREELTGKWIYSSTITGSETNGEQAYRVTVHVEGNFPGGVADLSFQFRLDDGLISKLFIAE